MKAIGVFDFGGPEALRVLDLPEPQAGPGEVRIRVHAAAVNPTDVLLRTGGHAVRMPGREPPFVPGMDAAGVIDQVGPGAGDRLAVGQRVVAMVLFTGPRGEPMRSGSSCPRRPWCPRRRVRISPRLRRCS